ncbi:hypothetical protein OAD80_04635 [Porticoccaceae bacterium]|nr:hypothetical protein [Porticoccaceae bacterium]
MAKYQIYGIGAALADTEVVVSDEFLKLNAIEKGEPTVSMGAYLNVISALDLNLHLTNKLQDSSGIAHSCDSFGKG